MYNLNQDHIASLQISAISTAVVLKLERASESPGGLVQSQMAGCHPQSFWFSTQVWCGPQEFMFLP